MVNWCPGFVSQLKSTFNREGIKGLKLRSCGKLNSTHPGKLRQPQQVLIVHCGCCNARAAAIHKVDVVARVLRLLHCGSCIAAFTAPAKVHEAPQNTKCRSTLGRDSRVIRLPQYMTSYTVAPSCTMAAPQ